MTFEETIKVSAFSAMLVIGFGLVGHFLIVFLQYRHDRFKFFREKVLERYSLFVAEASSELQRAKTQSAISMGMPYEPLHVDIKMTELNTLRLVNKTELDKLSFQIRILDTDLSTIELARLVITGMPYYIPYFRGPDTGPHEQKLRAGYEDQISKFEIAIENLVNAISAKHARSNRTWIRRFFCDWAPLDNCSQPVKVGHQI